MEAKSYYGSTGGACSRGHLRALPEHSSVRIMNGVCHENKRTPYPLCHSFFTAGISGIVFFLSFLHFSVSRIM